VFDTAQENLRFQQTQNTGLAGGIELMIGIEPYNVEYITDEKAMYAPMFIA